MRRAAAALSLLCVACSAPPPSGSPVSESRADALFTRHCAACHGLTGEADSAVAEMLRPRPRSFALGSFNLVSTENGVPTEDDLVRTLERGLPGSAMASFAWLPEADLRLLARRVRELAIDGHVAAREARARTAGVRFDPVRARQLAERAMTPGIEVAVPEPVAPTAAILARGEELYGERCAACHGRDGRGLGEPTWTDRPEFAWPRDLRAGVLKGGASFGELYRRVACGMPAVGMPPVRLPEEDTAALVTFVSSMLPPDADSRFVQRRTELVCRRVPALPVDPGDPRWQITPVVLAPLQIHVDAVVEADVAFLHDGKEFAVLLRWPDATRDDEPTGIFPDAAAVQLADDPDPPAVAMGWPTHPVHIWHWQAFRPRDVAGDLDAFAPLPGDTRVDVPRQPRPAPFAAPAAGALPVHGRGAGHLSPFRDAEAELAAQARWHDGTWTLLVRRPLPGRSHEDIDLVPGRRIHVACAVWNGAAHDRGVRKSITVWHRLTIAR